MRDKSFSIRNVLATGWNDLENNFSTFAGSMAIIMGISILSFLLNVASSFLEPVNFGLPFEFDIILTIISFLILFVLNIISMLLYYGVKKVAIRIVSKKEVKISNIFLDYSIILKLLLYHVLLIIAGGILFLIGGAFLAILAMILGAAFESPILVGSLFLVVGLLLVYLLLRLIFITYFIVDNNLNLKQAIKYSLKITDGVVGKLFLLNVVLIIMDFIGVVFGLILGSIFITKPFSISTMAVVYRNLVKQSGLLEQVESKKKQVNLEG